MIIKPRNDYVVCRAKKIEHLRGLAMPDISRESEEYYVEAMGPLVEDLKLGDRVLVTGQKDLNWSFIPGFPGLFITKQENVVLVIEREE